MLQKTESPLRAFILAASLMLAGCAGVPAQICAPGTMPMIQAQLFFGRDVAGRAMVSEEEWRRFLDEEVTPRFPGGLSVADVSGQWRDAGGTIVREESKVLLILMRGGPEDEGRLNAIRDSYKRRFNQDAVLLVELPVCAAF